MYTSAMYVGKTVGSSGNKNVCFACLDHLERYNTNNIISISVTLPKVAKTIKARIFVGQKLHYFY
jgi:hypothetical protein